MLIYIPKLNADKVKQFLFIILLFSIIFTMLPNKHFNEPDDIEEKNFFKRFLNRLYFTIITVSSVGYGEYYPKTMLSKVLVSLLMCYVLFIIILSSN